MPNSAGKGGKRKSTMEGFNNVPKILEEARRMVDIVTEPDITDESTVTKQAEATVRPSSPVKPKKSTAKITSTQAAPDAKAAPPKKTKEKPAVKAPAKPASEKKPPVVTAAAVAIDPEKFGVRIIHRVPGRTRVELRQMKQNNVLAKKVEERLIVVPGILAVETSTITGRAVVYYNSAVFCQPPALQGLQNAWQDLFPGMQTDKLVAAMTSQQPH